MHIGKAYMKQHLYKTTIEWTGNLGKGTADYRSYERNHIVKVNGKVDIATSSDPAFRGDPARHNPEELFLASIASCHMLWYLHLCTEAGVIVTAYTDQAEGTMEETANGSGRFTEVILYPAVQVLEAHMQEKADALHHKAHQFCFIANSCNFPIRHKPVSYV
ncbi:OsmC family protein [Dyadobacter crusticola]|uniref:OsmC family protein n=1 Tax=Dyadobacter crusticola TaxID=292407 RepID=UPI0004E14464|nr:OsmC family protein [Dyadobacter crusticola]